MSKTKDFIGQTRLSASVNRDLVQVPGQRTQRSWPLCLTCGREVEAVELKDANSFSCTLWARCHGKEDFYIIKFPFRVEGDPLEDPRSNKHIQQAMYAFCPFNPNEPSK